MVQILNCNILERVLLNGAICKRFSKVSRRWRCAACHLLQVFTLLLLLLLLLSLLLLSMMTLITGFTCPLTIYFKFITKCDKCYYKVRQLFYYKVRQLLQSVTILLQSATGIPKCDDCYKVRLFTRCLHHLSESSNTGILVALVIKQAHTLVSPLLFYELAIIN